MYDVDGNGVIDQEEMTKIVQVNLSSKSTPRNIAVCLQNTANWDSNFLQLKTPINLLAHIANNRWTNSLKSENGGEIGLKCFKCRRSTTCWVRGRWSQRTRRRREPRTSSTGSSKSSIISSTTTTLPHLPADIDTSAVKVIATNAFNRQCKVVFFGNLLQPMWSAKTG